MTNQTTQAVTIGDTLICKNITPLGNNKIAPPLELEKEYPALNTTTCSCGKQHIDVGLVSEYNYVRCFDCEEELPKSDKIHWCHPSRFEIKK